MHGILKSNHQRLCEFLQDIKTAYPSGVKHLNELEDELQSAFIKYQEKMVELKRLVHMYGEKEKIIKNEIKRIRKYSLPDPKKINNFTLGKTVV